MMSETMLPGAVHLEIADRLALVTLANPKTRNALSLATLRELLAVLERIGGDREIAVVIVRAQGPAFSSGHDLREILATTGEDALDTQRELFETCGRLMTALQRLPQPVIAEVAGVATAAGCQLVASCDLAVAASDARFATPGVKIGLFCTTPMVALTRAIGRKRAMEMLLTGEFIDAETAEHWGLINRVVQPEQLSVETHALARAIASASAAIVSLGKAAFYEQIERRQDDAYAYAAQIMAENALQPDAREGMSAFLERREPTWSR